MQWSAGTEVLSQEWTAWPRVQRASGRLKISERMRRGIKCFWETGSSWNMQDLDILILFKK